MTVQRVSMSMHNEVTVGSCCGVVEATMADAAARLRWNFVDLNLASVSSATGLLTLCPCRTRSAIIIIYGCLSATWTVDAAEERTMRRSGKRVHRWSRCGCLRNSAHVSGCAWMTFATSSMGGMVYCMTSWYVSMRSGYSSSVANDLMVLTVACVSKGSCSLTVSVFFAYATASLPEMYTCLADVLPRMCAMMCFMYISTLGTTSPNLTSS